MRSIITTQQSILIEQQVEELLANAIPEVDLRAVDVSGRPGSGVLSVVIAHPERVDHALCVRVTHVLGEAGLRDAYAVEVSSPGLEPPLRVTRHFLDAVGAQVALSVKPGSVPGVAKLLSGTLTDATETSLTVQSSAGVVVVPRDAVRRARMVKAESDDDGRSLT